MAHLHSTRRVHYFDQSPRTRRAGNASRFAGKLIRRAFFVSLLGLVFVLALGSAAQAAPPQPAIWTDKADYHPGEIVTIYGVEFRQNKTIDISVTRPDANVDTWTTTSDVNGTFVTTYDLNGIVGNYTVEATDGRRIATTTFSDSIQVLWTQCENDSDNNDKYDTDCNWITGALNPNNAIVTEGNNIPDNAPGAGTPVGTYTITPPGHVNFRAIFEDLPGDSTSPPSYEIVIEYQFTKGGKAAYDFLTTSYGVSDANLCTDLPSGVILSDCTGVVPTDLSDVPIPSESESLPSLGGTIATRQTVHDSAFTGLSPRTLRMYGANIVLITNNLISGSDAGDSKDSITIEFEKDTPPSQPVILTWGGHFGIGQATAAGYGDGNGAASISGAPFHMTLDVLREKGGSSLVKGSRDLAVQPSAVILPGFIVVEKVTNPSGDTTPFDFDASYHVSPFTLTDGNSDLSPALIPGVHYVNETPETGWTLTQIACSIDPTTGTSSFIIGRFTAGVFGNGGSDGFDAGDTSIKITLEEDETVSCTYTNTKKGDIEVDKVTDRAAPPRSSTLTHPTTSAPSPSPTGSRTTAATSTPASTGSTRPSLVAGISSTSSAP